MAREAQTAAFDNFENSPYTETNAMQNGDEEVGTRGGYGRRLPNGLAFSEEARRAEGKTPEKPAFSGTGSTDNGIPEDGGSRFGGETPEKVREINETGAAMPTVNRMQLTTRRRYERRRSLRR